MVNTNYVLSILVLIIVAVTLLCCISAYRSLTEGVKDGMRLFLDIYLALLAIMCTITFLRQNGLMDISYSALATHITSIPRETRPMVIFHPISGSTSLAMLVDILRVRGTDPPAGNTASIVQGFTDMTVYMTALYFFSVGVRRVKNVLAIGLLADVAGISTATLLALCVLI